MSLGDVPLYLSCLLPLSLLSAVPRPWSNTDTETDIEMAAPEAFSDLNAEPQRPSILGQFSLRNTAP